MKTLKDADFRGKKVIVRVDYNVPLGEDGSIKDHGRIKASIPTIRELLDKGATQLILMSHVGRPKNKEEKFKTDKIAVRLGELLGEEVVKVDDWGKIPDAKIVMLENLRFNPAEKSKDESERDAFGKQLASLADIYVNEAFSNSHRNHASMTSVPKFIPGYAGFGLEREVNTLVKSVQNPEHPVIAIVGGVKEEKVKAIKHLLTFADRVLVGGAMIFWIMKAKGEKIGNSKLDEEEYRESGEMIKEFMNDPKIIMPIDYILADKFGADANFKISNECEDGWMALDIGPKSIELYEEKLQGAKTVLWFGPIGVFEFEETANGTREIAHAIAELDAVKISGGGESGEAIKEFGLTEKWTLISTGGGASLKLISGGKLPAVEVLQ